MTRPEARGDNAGFLLAETLATLTISALVLAGLVGLGPLMLRMVDRSVAAIDATDDLGHMLTRLDHLVRSASRARLDGVRTPLFLFTGDDRHLVFAAPTDDPGALPVTQAVALRSDTEGHLFRAEATLPPRLAAVGDLRFGPERLIYAGVLPLRFGYEGHRPAGSSTSLWAVGDRLPSTITVEALDRATGRVVTSIRSVIAADADLGCLDGTFCGRDDISGAPPAAAPNQGATP